MPRTTATEANELEQALLAHGRDPDLAFDIWDIWEIRRNPDGYSTRPYVKEAKLMRNLQPNGNWRSSDSYSQWHSLHLEEDVNAAPARAPEPPALDDSIGARYIADKYADSKPQAQPDGDMLGFD